MTRVVRPSIASCIAWCTSRSFSASSALVASSSSRMGALRTRARAITSRWRWPPERVLARSPIGVSKPCGRAERKSEAWAADAAERTSSWLARARPKRMLSLAEPENSAASWATSAMRARTSRGSASRRSTPSMLIEPFIGS